MKIKSVVWLHNLTLPSTQGVPRDVSLCRHK